MLNRLVKRGFLRTVEEYGKSLASDKPADPKETKCHLAKLVLFSPSQSELRVTSLKTLADLKLKALIRPLLREITLLIRYKLQVRSSHEVCDDAHPRDRLVVKVAFVNGLSPRIPINSSIHR